MMEGLTIFVVVLSLSYSAKLCSGIDYEAESAKVFAEMGITDPTAREKDLARKIIYERNEKALYIEEKGRLEEKKNFHLNLSLIMFVTDTLEDFNKLYLQRCSTKNRPIHKSLMALKKTFDTFFNTTAIAEKPKYIQDMAEEITLLLRARNKTVEEFITEEVSTYDKCRDFVATYKEYCVKKVDREMCDMLIQKTPIIKEDFKSIVVQMNHKIATLTSERL